MLNMPTHQYRGLVLNDSRRGWPNLISKVLLLKLWIFELLTFVARMIILANKQAHQLIYNVCFTIVFIL